MDHFSAVVNNLRINQEALDLASAEIRRVEEASSVNLQVNNNLKAYSAVDSPQVLAVWEERQHLRLLSEESVQEVLVDSLADNLKEQA